jgi:hypothetical protein
VFVRLQEQTPPFVYVSPYHLMIPTCLRPHFLNQIERSLFVDYRGLVQIQKFKTKGSLMYIHTLRYNPMIPILTSLEDEWQGMNVMRGYKLRAIMIERC